jgi:hypothetical protein
MNSGTDSTSRKLTRRIRHHGFHPAQPDLDDRAENLDLGREVAINGRLGQTDLVGEHLCHSDS